jgi:hypothetical protein
LALLLTRIKKASKEKNKTVDFDINWLTDQYKNQQGKCLLTGISFSLERNSDNKRSYNPYAPSIDRIDSKGDYIKDNIRLVLLAVNISLNDWGEKIFENIAKNYLKTKKKRLITNPLFKL